MGWIKVYEEITREKVKKLDAACQTDKKGRGRRNKAQN